MIAKNTFRIVLSTARSARSAAAPASPRSFSQNRESERQDDDDTDRKSRRLPPSQTSKSPTAVAYVTSTGKIIVSRGAVEKSNSRCRHRALAFSRRQKAAVSRATIPKWAPERTIVLYDFDTARSKDLVHGTVREAFWSPDDSRFAYLQSQDQKWRVDSSPVSTPETAAPLYNGNVDSLQGWTDVHTVLANDPLGLSWIADDRPQQSVPLKEIYGDTFRLSDSDTIRINPVNPDLLLVSAKYFTAPAGAPPDAAGIFLYEIRAKRRVVLTPPEQWSSHGNGLATVSKSSILVACRPLHRSPTGFSGMAAGPVVMWMEPIL